MVRIDDVDGDGVDDLATVAGADADHDKEFSVKVLSGADGALLHGGSADSKSGRSIAGAGDVDNDGHADIIVGSRYAVERQCPDIFRPGRLAADQAGRQLGFRVSVAGPGDIDGDGRADIAAGAFYSKLSSGSVTVFTTAEVSSVDQSPGYLENRGPIFPDKSVSLPHWQRVLSMICSSLAKGAQYDLLKLRRNFVSFPVLCEPCSFRKGKWRMGWA